MDGGLTLDRKQTALDFHSKNFNCAQSVFAAFADDLGIDKKTALKISSCFGGGMRCGEVCGAVTGALMALGLKYGTGADYDLNNKKLTGKIAAKFINKFRENKGTILCRELLNSKEHADVCESAITDAVEIAEKMICG